MTYRSNIEEQLPQVRNNTIDVFVLLHKAMSFAVGDLANDIKRVELEPLGEVAGLILGRKKALRLVEEETSGVVDGWLVLDEGGHGERRVDASPESGMEGIVGGAEEGGLGMALGDGLLDDVEVGL